MKRSTRREFLRWGAAGSVAATAGCSFVDDGYRDGDADAGTAPDSSTPTPTGTGAGTPTAEPSYDGPVASLDLDANAPVSVRGAIYLPARAFNFYQMWRDYDPAVASRDLGYAVRVNLNAIRTWVSYEFWREDAGAFETAFEDFLDSADENGLKVLIGLFEGIGKEPTEENLTDEGLMTATGVSSPSNEVLSDRDRWEETREFVRWFMDRYAADERLLAIEVMNEPGWRDVRVEFSKAMYETMLENRGPVPLTVGSTSMAKNSGYADWGLDLFQCHYNFPTSEEQFRDALRQVMTLDDHLDEPVMLTEWQRIRSGAGFHNPPPREQRTPGYATMAPTITELGTSNFFWSLMIQPAYFSSQREVGILNGLFHEDGAVWNLEDARAIKAMSGDPSYEGEERSEWPEWAQPIQEEVYGE